MGAEERNDGLASSYRTYDEVQDARRRREEINVRCDALGLTASLSGGMSASAYMAEVDKILLYLLCKIDGNIDGYDEERAMALISPYEYEKCRASIKKFEDFQAAKADD